MAPDYWLIDVCVASVEPKKITLVATEGQVDEYKLGAPGSMA